MFWHSRLVYRRLKVHIECIDNLFDTGQIFSNHPFYDGKIDALVIICHEVSQREGASYILFFKAGEYLILQSILQTS